MTPKAYKTAAMALLRRFQPLSEKEWTESWHEFKFNGWKVGLHLRNHLKLTHCFASDWISIGILNPHELPPFCDHWKWNIHFSGPVESVREELLKELERRLERLTEFYQTESITTE